VDKALPEGSVEPVARAGEDSAGAVVAEVADAGAALRADRKASARCGARSE
jgi:hypothetical protein